MPTENSASESPATQPAQNNGKGDSGKRHNQPDKPIMQARNKTGVVKWFSFKNGYGFITVDGDGDDIFVHRSEFIREGAREVFYHVNVGDKLEFDIINRAKGREAVAVTGPNGVRIPGSPANFNRRNGGRGRFNSSRNRNQNHEDHFVDAEEHHDEEAENKPPNGEARKKGGRGGGGRRRNASNEENGHQQGSGGDNAGDNNKNGGQRRIRKNTGRRGRGPRNADAQEQPQQDKKE